MLYKDGHRMTSNELYTALETIYGETQLLHDICNHSNSDMLEEFLSETADPDNENDSYDNEDEED